MKILKFPDPLLFQQAETVTVFETELKVLLDTMYRTMQEYHGIGLAANQVGLKFDMFVMQSEANEKIYLVNPKITKQSMVVTLTKEGCLSAPGELLVTGNRAQWVAVDYQNEKGEKKTRVFHNIDAVCAQHEIEHLRGESFMESKSIPKKIRKELAKKWKIDIK